MATKKQADVQAQIANSLKMMEDLNKIHEKYANNAKSDEEKLSELLEIQANKLRMINELKAHYNYLSDEQKRKLGTLTDEYTKQYDKLKGINSQIKTASEGQERWAFFVKKTNQGLEAAWKYLMSSDKVIRETTRNLGLSGERAKELRTTFNLSARAVAEMGGTIGDIQKMMEGYADETGRVRVLSDQMVESIEAMGLGTGMGVEQATKLAAQFESMGVDANSSMKYLQGIVDTSERMGINTLKVIKNINDNFRRLQTYTFRNGSKAIAEMAISAEKTRVSMDDALNIADAARNLESVIEMGANLQVMGGQFATMDPLQFMHTARNEPEKLNDQISQMTKGLYTLRKQADGTFEAFISPADVDRMRAVAKSLNMSNERIAEIAQRRMLLENIGRTLRKFNFTKEQQEYLLNAATLNKQTGKFEIAVAGHMKEINSLTRTQADAFLSEQTTLKERAIAAQDFETALNATIEEFKTILLPMLKGVNKFLETVRPFVEKVIKVIDKLSKSDIGAGFLKAAGYLMAAGYLVNTALTSFTRSGRGILERVGLGGVGGGGGKVTGKSGKPLTGVARESFTKARREQTLASGKASMMKGAGIGAAALGIGAGIGIAAVGISKLAEAMAKLDKTQIWALPATIGALAVAIAAFTIPLAFMGPVLAGASGGLLAFGAAALMIGAGIGIAAFGIGKMAEGLGTLAEKSKGVGKDFLMVAGGIAAIAASIAIFSNPFTVVGALAFAGVMTTIIGASIAAANVANSMANMAVAMKGSKDDFIAVQNAVTAISNANTKGGGMIAELARLVKQPLKVEFADKEVTLMNDITLNLDGNQLMRKAYDVRIAIAKHEYAKHGLGGPKS